MKIMLTLEEEELHWSFILVLKLADVMRKNQLEAVLFKLTVTVTEMAKYD